MFERTETTDSTEEKMTERIKKTERTEDSNE